jgi:hypothetical protein
MARNAGPSTFAPLFLSRARTKGSPVRSKLLSLSVLASLALAAAPALADTASGEVLKVDRYSKSVEIKASDTQRKVRFFLAHGGQVTRDGQSVNFATLKPGERVEIDYSRSGTNSVASTVAVVPEAVATAH